MSALETLGDRLVFSPGGCWHWTGQISEAGYGLVYIAGRKQRAHRAMYELVNGAVGEGLEVHHRCHVRHCVNPEHLEAVTGRENKLQNERTGSETHCVRGHELTPENLAIRARGSRRCRQCDRDDAQARYRRTPGAVTPEAASPLKEKASSGV